MVGHPNFDLKNYRKSLKNNLNEKFPKTVSFITNGSYRPKTALLPSKNEKLQMTFSLTSPFMAGEGTENTGKNSNVCSNRDTKVTQ